MPWMSYDSTPRTTMAKNPDHAYVTLLMTDNYLPGAMVLAHSLRDSGTTKQLVVLITLDTVSAAVIEELHKVYDQVIPVERVSNTSPANLYLMGREDLASTFSKICIWKMTQFKRVVYIDADVVALRAPDELFDLTSNFAAAPDVGWPDIFNSGVMALTPNMQDYYALQALARNGVSFDGADQGLLNMHFTRNLWERLSFTYNCTPSGNYQYAPAYRHFGSQINLVHFIGRQKPWQAGRHAVGFGGAYQEMTARWWSVYDSHYRGPTNQAISGQAPAEKRITQQHVTGEANTYDIGYSSAPIQPQPQSHSQSNQHQQHDASQSHSTPHQIPTTVVHPPSPPNEQHQHVVEERRWSAPHVEWNPAREPPPAESKPEAANFPSQVYTMSEDTHLFKAPQSYPEPPKDMWYEIPKEKPQVNEPPRHIFPWEATQTRATRVFPDEAPLPPVPNPDHQPPPMPALETPASSKPEEEIENPTTQVASPPGITSQPFASYSRTNAWDDIPGIQQFMVAFEARRKGKHTPTASLTSVGQPGEQKDRRPSLILTDFPTEVERPSLPVTPAPIRRTVLWGSDQEELPPAEGVPPQESWDPSSRLDDLQRRQSETFLAGPGTIKALPIRQQIGDDIPATLEEDTEVPTVSTTSSSTTLLKDLPPPTFGAVDFSSSETTAEAEEALSPVATAPA